MGVGGVVVLVALLFCISPWGGAVDRFLYDSHFLVRGSLGTPDEIVIVAIDEPSFGVIARQWPWPRSLHGRLVESLFRSGARVVAFDMIFAEPSTPEEDQAFATAIRRHPGTILASDLSLTEESAYMQEIVVSPFPELLSPATEVGFIDFPVDPDGFVRRTRLSRDGDFSLAFLAANTFLEREGRSRLEAPRGASPEYQGINFLGQPRTVRTVSYYQALDPERHLPPAFFRDKMVFVGIVIQSTSEFRTRRPDHYPIPFSRRDTGYMAGVEIHAQVAHDLLHHSLVRYPPRHLPVLLGVLAGLVSLFLFLRLKPMAGALVMVLEVAGVFAVTHLLFQRWQYYFPSIFLQLPFCAGYLASPFWHYYRAWRERNFIRRAFARYVAPSVVNQLLSDPERLTLGGEAVEATVLFSDLAGFTSFSEGIAPHNLIDLLNRYFGRFSDIVLAAEGMIDKYIGDAVMAVWGVPVAQPNHAVMACTAALKMRQAAAELGRVEEGLTGVRLQVKIGINSGKMVAGNVGASRHFNYTVLGNEVNVASRLEGVNRRYNTDIIVGENTAAQAGERFLLRELDLVKVKGKTEPLRIFELMAENESASRDQIKLLRVFGEGRALYREQRFREALSLFEECLATVPDDGPSMVYRERCRFYGETPPGRDWDGIYVMDEK